MTDNHWEKLIHVIKGNTSEPLPIGFIIDSPWLPGWYGINILDYYSNDDLWFKANLHAVNSFPDIIFLPGFWSEYGMCSEPSAFGARCSFPRNEFPHAHRCIESVGEIKNLTRPNPETDGLGPFILNRLKINKKRIEDSGHRIRFSISRGPLNIGSYLMGTTEFLMAMMSNPKEIHSLVRMITDYLIDWHSLQKDYFPDIDGMLVLDDIIGFISEAQFREFGLPYFTDLFDRDDTVKFLHNDASCMESISYLPQMGVNLFNMGFETDLNQLRELTDHKVTMLGNIPPRDVLANGSPDAVVNSVNNLLVKLDDRSHIILSCGGGMPPGVSTENLQAFIQAASK